MPVENPVISEDILQVTCDEPSGKITHTVRRLILTPQNLHTFWTKARQFKTLFNQEVRDDFKKFLEVFLRDGPNGVETNGLFWVVDDFMGLLYITDIVPECDALAEYTFFDRRTRGREPLVRAMLKYVFDKYNFNRLTVEVGVYAHPATMKFIESVGFKNEGRKRRATLFDNKWFDVLIYGILKEELTDAPVN